MNEKALIKKCQRGDKNAFEQLIRFYYPYVSGFLLKTTEDNMLAEDLTQDTFLRMIRGIDKFNPNGDAAFGTWLITIAKNLYIDYLRRNRIHLENIDDLPLADNKDMAEGVVKKIELDEVRQAIETLPPEQGLAIKLKYEEDMTLAQIAEQFKVPPKTIKSRIHDGTVKLRKKLKKGSMDYE